MVPCSLLRPGGGTTNQSPELQSRQVTAWDLQPRLPALVVGFWESRLRLFFGRALGQLHDGRDALADIDGSFADDRDDAGAKIGIGIDVVVR